MYSYSKKEELGKAKRLAETIERIENRTVFEAAIAYVIGAAAGKFCMAMGGIGFILTLIFFLAHCSELHKVSKYISIKREIAFSVLAALVILGL